MSKIAKYSIIELYPNPERREVVTVGLLILFENKWDICVLPDTKKIGALNPLFPSDGMLKIHSSIEYFLDGANSMEDARSSLSRIGGSLRIQEFIGQFVALDLNQYNSEIKWLLEELVIPPRIPDDVKKLVTLSTQQNRLRTRLRKQFKNRHLLASKGEKIDDHKVVEQFPIAAAQGLFAEFALKNSVMHITETVDFDVGDAGKRHKTLEAQAKTLILSAAKQHLGKSTKTYVVVAGSNRNIAKSSINLLSDYAEVFELESSSDMESYFSKIYRAANAPQGILKHTH